MKIAVYGIAKNEEKNVFKFVDSAEDADIILVGVDPGDPTGDMLENYGAKVIRVDLPKFRFDQYRNVVLQHLPDDIDVCVSLDLDERLPAGWRKIVEDNWKNGVTRLHYLLKNGDFVFHYDRIHARHGYTWMYPNHECVVALNPALEKTAVTDLTIIHEHDSTKDRSKNLGLLEYAVGVDPSSRMYWYLGREYYMLQRYEDGFKAFIEYFKFRPTWRPEACWAAIFAARCLGKLNRKVEQEIWLHAATRLCHDLRDPYFELAKLSAARREWPHVLQQLRMMSGMRVNTHKFFHENGAYSEKFYILQALACHELGLEQDCKDAMEKANRINPDCEMEMELG